ncbi:MAG: Bug family tripartite tricarboxylate transporter substrate binding protein [Burkholderiales bacterium]
MKRRDLLQSSLALSVGLAASGSLRAQGRVLRIVVPYAAGGGVDAQARALGVPLGTILSRNIIIENRAGGNTKIGTDAVRRAAPDGSTILLMPAVAWVGFVASGSFDYDPWKTLVPVCQIAETPYNFLQTRAGSGLDSWAKVRAHAQRTPGGIKIGGPSAGGFIEYTVDEMLRRASITGVYAAFNGAAPAHTALLGGTVDMQIVTYGDGVAKMASGATYGIAVSAATRQARAPQVPTFVELGIGETLSNSFSLWAAPGTPAAAVDEIAVAVRTAMADAAFRKLMEDQLAFNVAFKDAAGVAADMAAVERDWGPRLRGGR